VSQRADLDVFEDRKIPVPCWELNTGWPSPYPSAYTGYDMPAELSYITHIQAQVDRQAPVNKGKPQISCSRLKESVTAEHNIFCALSLIGYWEGRFQVM
jgi:hypothetical protein